MEYTVGSPFRMESVAMTPDQLNVTIYNPPGGMDLKHKFWWEAFGMFGLITLICNIKIFYGFDFWVSAILPVAIMLSVKQSGAHYNPSMTISNFLIKFSP
jgi:glycerol uptake facilitator-like aquaporin